MSEPPGAVAAWWDAAPGGATTPIALVRVGLVGSGPTWSELPAEAVLRRRVRFTAGVEYIAGAFGAMQPLSWQGDSVTLVLGGASAEELPELAFQCAKQLWERMRLDLDLPARIAVHATLIPWSPDAVAAEDAALRCLHDGAAAGCVVLSEDVALALSEEAHREIAPAGTSDADGAPTYVFPADAACGEADLTQEDRRVWEAVRRYAQSPEVRLLRYVGFRLQKKQPPRLDVRDVFVPSEVEVKKPHGPDITGLLAANHPGVRPPRSRDALPEPPRVVAFEEIFAKHRGVVVLGDPGSGKTTLLRWLSVIAAGGRFAAASQAGIAERLLPLLVSVGRLAEVRRSFPGERAAVPDTLARYFHDRGAGEEHALRAVITRELETGRCLLLLDGLDEVSAGERDSIHRWLEALAAAYPASRYVVTSRVVGYAGFRLPDGVEIELRPFDEQRVEWYVRALHRAWTRWETGAEATEEADAEAGKLLDAIHAGPRLGTLARNPFLLSALALIHRAEGRLPRHRVQAYELFARALCETWADARRIVAGEAAGATIAYDEEALPILGDLAVAMHERYPTGAAPEAFVIEALGRALIAQKGVAEEVAHRAAREFLSRAGEEVQILLERGAGSWGFLHLTFQEFFAAAGLHAAERFEDVALAHLFDPRWEEVIRLGVGYMALVQKRPAAARRFVERVLAWEEPEPRRWVTGVLGKQVPLAALLAAEAGDSLPAALQERVATALAAWVVDAPSEEAARECLRELSLTDFSERVAAALVQCLRHESSSIRQQAAQALGALALAFTAEPLAALLSDPEEGVRDEAVQALWLVRPSDELLEPLTKSDNAGTRGLALEALIRSSPEPEKWLRRALRDQDATVREYGLAALFDNYPPSPVPSSMVESLIDATRDESPSVRSEAAELLATAETALDNVELALLRLAHDDENQLVRAQAVLALFDRDNREVEIDTVIDIISSDDANGDTSQQIIEGLSSLYEREPLERSLMAALKGGDARRRRAAVEAFSEISSDTALRALLEATRDPSPEVREAALWGLASHKSSKSEETLVAALHDPRPEVRRVAHFRMLRSASNIDACLAATHDRDAGIRSAAVFALGRFDDPRAFEMAASALHDEDRAVRSAAANALKELMPGPAEPLLLSALDDVDADVRRTVAFVLGESGSAAAVPRLADLASHNADARRALWEIFERQSREP